GNWLFHRISKSAVQALENRRDCRYFIGHRSGRFAKLSRFVYLWRIGPVCFALSRRRLMPGSKKEGPNAGFARQHLVFYVAMAVIGGLRTFAGARAQQKATDDATFRKLLDGYCTAWSSGNPSNAAKYYAKDDGLVFYDAAPFSYTGWKD